MPAPEPTSTPALATRFRLDGRVAIVTGASRGIGEAIARALAEAGARVVASSRRQEAVDGVAASIRDAGGDAIGVAAHAGRAADLARLVDACVERFGRLDVVVNNAATNPVYGPLVDTGADVYDKIMDVNLRGPLELARSAHPHLVAAGGGAVVNISSIEGLTPSEGLGLYSVSKAALISLTRAMAREWGAAGIRVNAICPGLIRTRFSAALWQDDTVRESFLSRTPLHRVGTPDEVAALALFLASDAGSYCTGGVFTADGGYTT
jgi:NAD(P)-dependent dehydrogenase (short-subunit alcohol dehydrogenase family)